VVSFVWSQIQEKSLGGGAADVGKTCPTGDMEQPYFLIPFTIILLLEALCKRFGNAFGRPYDRMRRICDAVLSFQHDCSKFCAALRQGSSIKRDRTSHQDC